jgi:hypothetical protein
MKTTPPCPSDNAFRKTLLRMVKITVPEVASTLMQPPSPDCDRQPFTSTPSITTLVSAALEPVIVIKRCVAVAPATLPVLRTLVPVAVPAAAVLLLKSKATFWPGVLDWMLMEPVTGMFELVIVTPGVKLMLAPTPTLLNKVVTTLSRVVPAARLFKSTVWSQPFEAVQSGSSKPQPQLQTPSPRS